MNIGDEKMKKSLVNQTSDELINYILDHNLQAGDKLPNEFELTQELDIGRSTLREAVRALVSRNILEVRQGSGTYISDKKGIIEDPLGFMWVKDNLKLTEDLFEIRYLLEPKMAMLAAQNANEQDIEELVRVKDLIEGSIFLEQNNHLQLDIEFHSIIARASGNVAMDHLIPVINQSIVLYNDYYTDEQSKKDTLTSHQEIVEAIVSGNSAAAFDAMLIHITNNRRKLHKKD